MMQLKVGVIVPSRGLIVSYTAEGLVRYGRSMGSGALEFYFAHQRPIPECFNEPAQKALDEYCSVLLFIEDDIIAPNSALRELVNEVHTEKADIAFANYYTTGNREVTQREPFLYSGTGCMAVSAKAARKLLPFRGVGYTGGADVDWYRRAADLGLAVAELPIVVGHAKVEYDKLTVDGPAAMVVY